MAVPRKPHTVIPYVSTAIDCTHRIYSTSYIFCSIHLQRESLIGDLILGVEKVSFILFNAAETPDLL
jgi:hypothetical protein